MGNKDNIVALTALWCLNVYRPAESPIDAPYELKGSAASTAVAVGSDDSYPGFPLNRCITLSDVADGKHDKFKTFDMLAIVHDKPTADDANPRVLTLVDETGQLLDLVAYGLTGPVEIRDTIAIKFAKTTVRNGDLVLLALNYAIIRVNTPHHPERTAALQMYYDNAIAAAGAPGGSASSSGGGASSAGGAASS